MLHVNFQMASLAHMRNLKAKNSHKYAAINAAQRVEVNTTPSTTPKKFKRARFEDSDEEDESSRKRDKVYMSSGKFSRARKCI